MKKKTQENPVYIKLEYREAVLSKKDVLFIQMSLLKISKKIESYKSDRIKEIIIKAELYKKIKETKTNIMQIKTNIPEILKKDTKEKSELKSKTKIQDRRIEEQLQEIQRRIEELQKRTY